jgi:hypothetical protein
VTAVALWYAAERPKWTDVAQAWGSMGASVLTFFALVATVWLARLDRKRSAALLEEEVRRGQDALREQRAEAAAEQLRIFQLSTLLRIIDLYSELAAAAPSDQPTRTRVATALRALLSCLPEDVATLVRYDTDIINTARSQNAAATWLRRSGRPLQRPVPAELVAAEIESNIARFLPQAR